MHHLFTRQTLKNFLIVSAGNFLYTFGVVFFILPGNLLTGGTTGLALFLNHALGIPITVFVYIFNIAMFLAGSKVLGKKFALTTALSTFEYPTFLALLQLISAAAGPLTQDLLLSTIFGGICIGGGLGIVIQTGASTGGMDIPALLLNRWFGLSVSAIINISDMVIILLQFFYADVDRILYGLLLVMVYTLVLNKVLAGGKEQVALHIVSPKYEEINQAILSDLDRGATLYKIRGGLSGEELWAVQTIVSPRQLFRLQNIVKKIDPSAFITVSEMREVSGRGFSLKKVYRQTPPGKSTAARQEQAQPGRTEP